MQQFEVTLIIQGDDETTPDELTHAMRRLLCSRFSPDHRFDFKGYDLSVSNYQGIATPMPTAPVSNRRTNGAA